MLSFCVINFKSIYEFSKLFHIIYNLRHSIGFQCYFVNQNFVKPRKYIIKISDIIKKLLFALLNASLSSANISLILQLSHFINIGSRQRNVRSKENAYTFATVYYRFVIVYISTTLFRNIKNASAVKVYFFSVIKIFVSPQSFAPN